jgi:hypothetical protein
MGRMASLITTVAAEIINKVKIIRHFAERDCLTMAK